MTQKINYIYNAIVLKVINKATYDVEIDLGFSHKVTQTIHLYNHDSYEASFEENQTKKEKESLRRARFRPPRVSSRTSALLSCGSPQGHWFAEGISPPFAKCWCVRHSLHLATISSWCVSRSSCRSARRGIEPSRVPRRDDEDHWVAFADKTRRPDREFANVRGRASPRADASAERPDSAA